MNWKAKPKIDRYKWHIVFTWKPKKIKDFYYWLEFIERRWVRWCDDKANCGCDGYWEYKEKGSIQLKNS